MQRWLTRGVVGYVLWPTKETTINFGGHEILLKPATKNDEQAMCIRLDGINEKEAVRLFNQFLSILSWCDGGQSVQLIEGIIAAVPASIGVARKTGSSLSGTFEAFNRSPIDDPRKRLALALYREAVTVGSIPYSFLGFYKVIGVCFGENKSISNKIGEILPNLEDELAKKRLEELEANNIDIPSYLYNQRRCAIAHVTNDPVINPDEEDTWILSGDVYIVRAIAEYLIENELGISKTILSDKKEFE